MSLTRYKILRRLLNSEKIICYKNKLYLLLLRARTMLDTKSDNQREPLEVRTYNLRNIKILHEQDLPGNKNINKTKKKSQK